MPADLLKTLYNKHKARRIKSQAKRYTKVMTKLDDHGERWFKCMFRDIKGLRKVAKGLGYKEYVWLGEEDPYEHRLGFVLLMM